jgi:hypothetical protein
MAQQNPAEDTTDFSGLASSLLPPSGAFLSGWTRQQWQNFTASHNANDGPAVQQSFTNSYHNASFQNNLADSPTPYRPYDLNEYRTPDRPLGSGEALAAASGVQSDSGNAQIYKVCFTGFFGTLLTQVLGYERQRK